LYSLSRFIYFLLYRDACALVVLLFGDGLLLLLLFIQTYQARGYRVEIK